MPASLDSFRRSLPTAVGLLLVAAAGSALACSASTSPDLSGTSVGAPTVMGSGSVHSYLTTGRDGTPTELGVALTEGALVGLPAAITEFVIALPAQATATPYTHAVINWQPTGHPPMGMYMVPHFDVHFYSITQSERDAMTPADPQYATKLLRLPAGALAPTGYSADVMGIPRMGLHWGDPTSPEYSGQAFTSTFIYGSYDGKLIFAEPMLSKAYLESKPAADVKPVKQPGQYALSGYQPTSFTVSFDAVRKEYRIALTGLVLRSPGPAMAQVAR
jgi:hypothetical protein